MCDGSTRGWLAGGRGLSGRVQALHSSWRCTQGVVDGLALHRKLLRPRLGLQMGAF